MLGVAGKREREAIPTGEKVGEKRWGRGQEDEKKVRRRLGGKKDYVESERFDPEIFLESKNIYRY